MNLLFIFLDIIPTVENKEDIGVVSVLVFLLSALLGTVVYLHKSHKEEIKAKDLQMIDQLRIKDEQIKAKDERIKEVVREHTNDVKESNNDYKTLLEKHYRFADQIREIANVKREL